MSIRAEDLPPLADTISAEARQQLEVMLAMAHAAPPNPTISETRVQIEQIQNVIGAMQRQRYEVTAEQATIAGVPVVIYKPASGLRSRAVLLNFHGGGFTHDSGSQTENIPIAALTGMTVITALYRMAPEHPFPAAVDDAFAVYRELLANHDARDIAVFGTSAGAVLSSQLMERLREMQTPTPAAVGFFSGSADFSRSGDSEGFSPKVNGMTLTEGVAPYVGQTPTTLPALSPLYADLSNFPPTLVVSSTRDVLLSQSVIFHRALRKAGVDTELVVFEAMPHAFWAYILCPESDEAFATMAEFFNARLAHARNETEKAA